MQGLSECLFPSLSTDIVEYPTFSRQMLCSGVCFYVYTSSRRMLNQWLFTGVLGLICGVCEIKDESWNISAKGEEMS